MKLYSIPISGATMASRRGCRSGCTRRQPKCKWRIGDVGSAAEYEMSVPPGPPEAPNTKLTTYTLWCTCFYWISGMSSGPDCHWSPRQLPRQIPISISWPFGSFSTITNAGCCHVVTSHGFLTRPTLIFDWWCFNKELGSYLSLLGSANHWQIVEYFLNYSAKIFELWHNF